MKMLRRFFTASVALVTLFSCDQPEVDQDCTGQFKGKVLWKDCSTVIQVLDSEFSDAGIWKNPADGITYDKVFYASNGCKFDVVNYGVGDTIYFLVTNQELHCNWCHADIQQPAVSLNVIINKEPWECADNK